MGIAWQQCGKCGVNYALPASTDGPLRCPGCRELASPQFVAEPEPTEKAELKYFTFLAPNPPDEHPATCPHRADVLWLAGRLRRSEHEVAKLRRQRHQLERRLRKAKRKRA